MKGNNSTKKVYSKNREYSSIFKQNPSYFTDLSPNTIDKRIKRVSNAITKSKKSKFKESERKIIQSIANANSPKYSSINTSHKQHIFLRYLERIILPEYQKILPIFVKTTRNVVEMDHDLIKSMENFESKGNDISIGEIPLVFVLVNHVGHSSLFIVNGLIDEENIPQKIFSIGLLQTGEAVKSNAITKSINKIGVDINVSKVVINTPDKTINPFGLTKNGIEFGYNIVEIQILTTDILNNIIEQVSGKNTIIDKDGTLDIFTDEQYCTISNEVVPQFTGRNCSQFVTSVLPHTTSSAFYTGISIPDYIRSTRRPLNAKKIRNILQLAMHGTDTDEFIKILQ
jgi:hypothetical protein